MSLRMVRSAFADASMEAVCYFAYWASTELAEERGRYSSYKGSLWDRGLLPQDTLKLLRDERGGYVLQFWKHTGQCLAFVVPPNADNDVLPYFQERMPYGLAVPDVEGADQPENGLRFADRR